MLVGVLVGAVLGLVSVFGNMPMIVLAVLSSIAGAVSVVAGLMLIFGSLNSSDFTQAAFTNAVNDSWGWYLTLLALILVGIVARESGQRATWRHVDGLSARPGTSSRPDPSARIPGRARTMTHASGTLTSNGRSPGLAPRPGPGPALRCCRGGVLLAGPDRLQR